MISNTSSDGKDLVLGRLARVSGWIVRPATLGMLTAMLFAFISVNPGLSTNSSTTSPLWARIPLPAPLDAHRAVVVQIGGSEFLYLIGGKEAGTSISNKVHFARLSADEALSDWTATLPIPHTAGVREHSAVVVDDRIYVLGGRGNSWNTYNSVYCAKPEATGVISQWISVAQMPTGLALHAAVAVDNVIFVMGGYSSQRGGFVREVWAADITGGDCSNLQWRPQAEESLPRALAALSAVVMRLDNGKKFIYVTGGYDGSAHKSVWRAEVDSSGKLTPWVSLGDVPAPRGFFRHVSAVSGHYLYVIGGTTDGYDWLNTVYRARIQNDGNLEAWSTLDVFPESVFNHAVAVSAPGRIYVLGGNTNSGNLDRGYFTPLLDFEKSALPAGPVTYGDTISYTLRLTNLGVRDFDSLTITDTVQASASAVLSFHDLPVECQTCSDAGSAITCTCVIPNLVLGETKNLGFRVTISQLVPALLPTLNSPQDSGDGRSVAAEASPDYFLHGTEIVDPSIAYRLKQGRVSSSLELADVPDLGLEKSGDTTLVIAGQLLTYTLLAYNAGSPTVEDVVVADTLPDDVTFKSATPSPINSTNPLTWFLGSVPAMGSREIQLVVAVHPECSGILINIASVSSSTPDVNPDNNQDEEWTVVVKRADLRIEKGDYPDPVEPGETLTYTLIVTNEGPSDAQDVSVLDFLPPELEIIATNPLPVSGPSPLEWRLDLPTGQSQEIQIVATVDPETAGVIHNVAIVSSDIDPSLSNNVDEEWTTIGSSPTLIPVVNRAFVCEKDGLWCKYSNTVINSPFSVYLPIVLKLK